MKPSRTATLLVLLFGLPLLAIGFGGLEGLTECSDADLEEVCGQIHPDDSPRMALARSAARERGSARTAVRTDVPRCVRSEVAAQYSNMPAVGGWEDFSQLLSDAGGVAAEGSQGGFNPLAVAGEIFNSATGGVMGVSYDFSGLKSTTTMDTSHWGNLRNAALSGGATSLSDLLPTINYQAEGNISFYAKPELGRPERGQDLGEFTGNLGVSIRSTVTMRPH
ncbi:MAG: hypothetical protein JRI97_03950 [Deltaproteobacteria bacterium]|nr:hypothetical protein [Deltaproteobacteria bacterium]